MNLFRSLIQAGLAAVLVQTLAAAGPLAVKSPDGRLELSFQVGPDGSVRHSLAVAGQTVIAPSPVGFAGGALAGSSRRSVTAEWRPVWGKRAVVPDRYHELALDLTGYRLIARAYDDGVAFRYELPPGFAGKGERTAFHFAGDYTAWFYNGEHHNLGPEPLSASNGRRLPVMTVKVAQHSYLAIHEACLTEGEPLVLESKQGETSFRIASAPTTAWRVVFAGRTAGQMVDSHLLELLNPPPAAGMDFSWVKPGVAVWDWRIKGAVAGDFTYDMSLPSWLRMVDFAAANGMPHLVLDADWYGPEFSHTSDPVKGDKAGDVRKLIDYGRQHGVGIWLYLNDVGGRQYPLEETLRQYGEWGASGVKYGFMRGTPAEKNQRTRLITELCAKNQLLCDFHDGPVHPYGQLRTWPNAVTREFNHAQLDAKRVFQPKTFVTTVFVNMLAGPLDMNNGMFDLPQGKTTRVDNPMPVPSTLVAEAARTLIVFSGVTILPDIPEFYQKYPGLLAFLAAQQMPWRESRTLSGEIGEHIVMARQAADGTWLIGAATDETARELPIKLDFLPPGEFTAVITQDGPGADFRTNRETLRSERRQVTAGDTLKVSLAPGGGACILLKAGKPGK